MKVMNPFTNLLFMTRSQVNLKQKYLPNTMVFHPWDNISSCHMYQEHRSQGQTNRRYTSFVQNMDYINKVNHIGYNHSFKNKKENNKYEKKKVIKISILWKRMYLIAFSIFHYYLQALIIIASQLKCFLPNRKS